MYIDRVIFALLITAFFAAPSILSWFKIDGSPWYQPYLIWLGLITINYWLVGSRSRDKISPDEDSLF